MDSSYAAYLLKQQGYNVVGVTFRLFSDASSITIERAKKIAHDLSIPHHVIDLCREFHCHVVEPFVEGYKAGKTPNPCIFCNEHIKSTVFIKKALEMGARKVATGHYAIIENRDGNYFIRKGVDKTKDQSYFLYRIQQELLHYMLFPLGRFTKKSITHTVHSMKWDMGDAGESQDICFVGHRNYRTFLSRFITVQKGPIYYVDGTFMGYHNGIHLYTIGQRRGINIPYREPLYVIDIIPHEHTLIVGTQRDLQTHRVIADTVHFFTNRFHGRASGRVRYRQKEALCTYTISQGILEANFSEPISSVTPGQSLVLYENDTVIGGGIIRSKRFS